MKNRIYVPKELATLVCSLADTHKINKRNFCLMSLVQICYNIIMYEGVSEIIKKLAQIFGKEAWKIIINVLPKTDVQLLKRGFSIYLPEDLARLVNDITFQEKVDFEVFCLIGIASYYCSFIIDVEVVRLHCDLENKFKKSTWKLTQAQLEKLMRSKIPTKYLKSAA